MESRHPRSAAQPSWTPYFATDATRDVEKELARDYLVRQRQAAVLATLGGCGAGYALARSAAEMQPAVWGARVSFGRAGWMSRGALASLALVTLGGAAGAVVFGPRGSDAALQAQFSDAARAPPAPSVAHDAPAST